MKGGVEDERQIKINSSQVQLAFIRIAQAQEAGEEIITSQAVDIIISSMGNPRDLTEADFELIDEYLNKNE